MLGLLRNFLPCFNLVICILGFFYFIWTLKCIHNIAFYLFNIWKNYTLSLYLLYMLKIWFLSKKSFLASLHGLWVLLPQTGIEHGPPAVRAWSPYHWTTWKFPFFNFFISLLSILLNIFNKNTFGLVVSPYCNFVLCLDFALIIVFFLLLHLIFISSNFSFFIFNFLWCKLGFLLCFVLFQL